MKIFGVNSLIKENFTMSQNNNKELVGITGFVIAILTGVIVPLATPEIRCILFRNSCSPSPTLKEVKLITQTETGEPLAGVKVLVVGADVPEVENTDSNGYTNVKIPSEGKVRVNLSKPGSGYQPKDLIIDLRVDQNTPRIIQFTKSDQSKVEPVPTIASTVPLTIPTPTILSPGTTGTSGDTIVGQKIKYSGSVRNTTYNSTGNIVIEVVFEQNNLVSGYINFTNNPGIPVMCGAGNFQGIKQARYLQLRFVSNDPDPGCGLDRGLEFIVNATLSPDGSRLENGAYISNTSQVGVFQATSQ